MKTFKNISLWLLPFILFSNSVLSQETDTMKPKASIEHEILKMDSLFFNVAFNKCDLTLYKKIMSPDIEFYDDRSGLNTSFEVEIASFKDRCSRPFAVTRKLVSATVHVLGDYGAVEIGIHEFMRMVKKYKEENLLLSGKEKRGLGL